MMMSDRMMSGRISLSFNRSRTVIDRGDLVVSVAERQLDDLLNGDTVIRKKDSFRHGFAPLGSASKLPRTPRWDKSLRGMTAS
jgi:hypothetical protein